MLPITAGRRAAATAAAAAAEERLLGIRAKPEWAPLRRVDI